MIQGLNHITLASADLNSSTRFYEDVLGGSLKARWPKGRYFELGGVWVALILDPNFRTTPLPDYSHIAWSVDEKHFDVLAKRIQDSGAKIWQKNRSEGHSLYFLDPSGHKLEIHSGDFKSRLISAKENPWEGLEIFE